MKRSVAYPARYLLAVACMLGVLSQVFAIAQFTPAFAEAPAPATLRLAQVVLRTPNIDLYAIAQDETGATVPLPSTGLELVAGSVSLPVHIKLDQSGIGIVFLIDISKSLSPQQFDLIKRSVLAWISSMGPSDQAAIVTLGSAVNTIQDFTNDKRALSAKTEQLAPRDMNTLLYQGLVQAIDLSRRLDRNLPLRRAIVVLTDGLDDQQGGAGRQEVVDKLQLDPTPIYAIGAAPRNTTKVDEALKDFASLVRLSGGDYRRVNDIHNVDKGYLELRTIVRDTQHLVADCPMCDSDGSTRTARLVVSEGGAVVSSQTVTVRQVGQDGIAIPKPPVVTPPTPPAPPIPLAPRADTPPAMVAEPKPPPVVPHDAQPVQMPQAQPESWLHWLAGVVKDLSNIVDSVFRMAKNLNALYLLLLALGIFGAVGSAAVYFVFIAPPKGDEKPSPTKPRPQDPPVETTRLKLDILRPSELELGIYPFENDLTVGRAPDNTVKVTNDRQISALHCTLSPEGKSILVKDAGSRNGTRINGVPIADFLHAESGDVLGIGRTEIRMQILRPGAK